ncbi:MAG: tRNA (adenosine(37)-N6)-threonylcarbamoyltransferase complex dimerization subunit type 1 TsaB [Rubricoccaceae bacterium]
MLTLGIETAADICAVALLDGSGPLVELAIHTPRSHATRLAPLIRDALAHASAQPEDLDVIAVSAGPGSYTGLRIGLSTAKGLCLASNAALAPVPTLDALADAALPVSDPGDGVIVATRSRRGEIYGAAFEVQDDELVLTRESAPVAIEDLPDWLPSSARTWVVGDAALHVMDRLGPTARFLGTRSSALPVARRGRQLAADGRVVDVAMFEPSYLKPFEASQPRAIFPASSA